MSYETLVEKVRKVISDGGPIYGDPDKDARAILALVAEALKEPSEEMVEAAWSEEREYSVGEMPSETVYWQAMLRASPLHPPGDSLQPKDDV